MMQLDLMGKWKIYFGISLAVILVGLFFLFTQGLNLGIDFSNGTLFWLRFEEGVTADQVREFLDNEAASEIGIERYSVRPAENREMLIRTESLSGADQSRFMNLVRERLGEVEALSIDNVGAKISGELIKNAIISILIASVGILLYVAFRFEFRFGVVGVLALIHDVLVTIGLFAIFRIEVNSPFVAGILTVVGYSINDTIVIFDRIRENLAKRKEESIAEITNKSVNQVFTRSLLTSVTTLFGVIALLIFGFHSIMDFTLSMLFGLIAGAYSSLFLAAPMWALWREHDKRVEMKKEAQAGKA